MCLKWDCSVWKYSEKERKKKSNKSSSPEHKEKALWSLRVLTGDSDGKEIDALTKGRESEESLGKICKKINYFQNQPYVVFQRRIC